MSRAVAAIAVLNGPNLNALGRREPARYGHRRLPDLEREWAQWGEGRGLRVESFQSNFEGALIDRLHALEEEGVVGAVLLNAGAFTHTSRALRDAIASISVPVIEVHITHIGAREAWRRDSKISEVCYGSISGFGAHSYLLGLEAAAVLLERAEAPEGQPGEDGDG